MAHHLAMDVAQRRGDLRADLPHFGEREALVLTKRDHAPQEHALAQAGLHRLDEHDGAEIFERLQIVQARHARVLQTLDSLQLAGDVAARRLLGEQVGRTTLMRTSGSGMPALLA